MVKATLRAGKPYDGWIVGDGWRVPEFVAG